MEYETTLKGLREDKNQFVERIIKSAHVSKMSDISSMDEQTRSILERKIKRIYDHAKEVQKCSLMDSSIFHIITELITLYEGETYVLRNIDIHKDKSSPSTVWLTQMIMPESIYKRIENPRYVSERYFYHLLKNGLAINANPKIEKGLFMTPNAFTFYEIDSMGRLNPTTSFKGFPYVKQFIDFLIDYKVNNIHPELTSLEMHLLKEEFVRKNQDEIIKNYQSNKDRKIREATARIQEEYNHKVAVLSRKLK